LSACLIRIGRNIIGRDVSWRAIDDPYRVGAPVVPVGGTTAVGSTCFGAADVAFGVAGLAGFSANWLKQITRSFSSFEKRQSVTTLAGSGIG
jgi:hypothetical protein